MKITESRITDILYWLDDEAGNHALLFEKMTLHRDAAALIRQLQAELQDAWHAGLDAGREQGRGKDHAYQPPSVPVGVEGLPRYGFLDGNEPRPVPCADGYWTPWHLAQQPAAFDFAAHLHRQREWSETTFGPGARTAGLIDHIRKELLEIEAAPHDGEEWIDAVILALDGAWRCGLTPQQIVDGIVAKQAKNERRTWPDWRTADPTKAIEHDRASQQPAVVDAHELWAAAQLAPGEGIEDGVSRIENILNHATAQPGGSDNDR